MEWDNLLTFQAAEHPAIKNAVPEEFQDRVQDRFRLERERYLMKPSR
jgi:hypothetical protein